MTAYGVSLWHQPADWHCFQSGQMRPDNKPALTIWQQDRPPGSRMEPSPPPSFSSAPPDMLPTHGLEHILQRVRLASVPPINTVTHRRTQTQKYVLTCSPSLFHQPKNSSMRTMTLPGHISLVKNIYINFSINEMKTFLKTIRFMHFDSIFMPNKV